MSFGQAFPLSQFAIERRDGVKPEAVETFGPDLAVRLICPDCRDPNPRIAEEFGSGDLVCAGCGLVLGDRIVDTRSEWRTFANDEGDDPSRVGAAIDPMDGGEQLETMISFRDGGSGSAKELQRAASRGQSSRSERNLLTAFRDIGSWCDQFSLPNSVRDIAKQLYKRQDEEKILRTKPLDAVIAACIFIACRQAHVPRTFREICDLTNVSKKLLGQCYKALEGAFNLSPGSTATVRPDGASSTGPEQVLGRFCNHLALPPYVERMCFELVVKARQLGIAESRSPISIAGAAIHFVCLAVPINKNLTEISSVAGVGESTIRLVYRIFHGERKALIKEEWITSGKMKSFQALPADGSDRTIRKEQLEEEKAKAQQKATKSTPSASVSQANGIKKEAR